MISSTLSNSINEHTVEVRFKPNAKVLDYRGELAMSTSEHMSLTEWLIDENRIDIFDKQQIMRCFVSFRNAGALIRNTQVSDYFPNQANKFLRFALSQKPFPDPMEIERIGVRSRFAIPVTISFDTLLQNYISRVIQIPSKAQQVFNAIIIDIGIPINFSSICSMIRGERLTSRNRSARPHQHA